ncbi:MAG: radical SAM protein, partial [Candidatus Bathyarchaeota archaeon]|nr:radical SAM protein [Candidatus Bathyarchaeota archaeon]
FSFPITLIINEIKKAIIEGSIEIWLTGQDTGAYGRDIGIKLTDLLNKIIKIDKNFKIRVGMMNPNHMNDMIDELPSIYTNKKIYDFLHLPIQSGSDYVLKSMGRSYSTNEVKSIIGKFKNLLPNIVISTDIIVGFPTESEDDFNNSIKFVKDVKPDIVNISKFAPRPKTLASKLVQIPSTIIKDRSKQLSIICSEITEKRNKQYIDKKVEIIITKEIKPDLYEGRIQNYKKVLVNSKLNLLGKKIYGKIINSTQRYLEGEVVRSINSSQK